LGLHRKIALGSSYETVTPDNHLIFRREFCNAYV
jgi:hypothetical protein